MKWLEQAKVRFNALVGRERWLLALAAVVVVVLVVDSFLAKPLSDAVRDEQGKLQSAEQKLRSAQDQLVSLQQLVTQDPLVVKQKERDALKLEVVELEGELSRLAGGLMKSGELSLMLEKMLHDSSNLKLLEVKTLAPELQMPGVYKHEVHIRLAGGYLDVLAYLKKLEAQPWQFYWQALDYGVEQYPSAQVEIQVYTLSTAEDIYGA